jgi:hypothetical protein
MRFLSVAVCLGCCAALHASILPTYRVDSRALQYFENYVARFEKNTTAAFTESGKLWIDERSCCARSGASEPGKIFVEPRENMDIAGGSIHHFTGFMHIAGATIEDVARIMQDYPNYPKYFAPDVGKGSATLAPDSTPADQHYLAQLSLIQSTLWMSVSYDCTYDVHYLRLDPDRWESKSVSTDLREWRDAKDPGRGTYPEGDDHGFLWRTHTYWFVRQRNGGVDMELDSMTVSRPVPTGFAWWGTRRTHDAVEKILRDMKTALAGPRP